MKKGSLAPNLKLSLPPPDDISKFLTGSGTFKDGDLLVNRDGVRIVSQAETEAPALIQPSDNQLSLADFDAVQVISKGNGGIVRLVQQQLRRKPTGKVLNFAGSYFSGPIPPEYGSFKSEISDGAGESEISDANISGQIPKQLSNLTKLESLFLFKKQLIGKLPPELSKISTLKIISFSAFLFYFHIFNRRI
ncbi:hypothetical protein ABFS83_11G085500 [Erythranthe nasuta]